MSAPHVHAISSAKKFGGKMEDYIHLHEKMDCSKAYMPDNRHRVLTHTMFWIKEVMVPLYGSVMTNSDGKIVSIKDICEQHILEDYRHKFIPTPQDFIQHMEIKSWMQNAIAGLPTSCELLYKKKKEIPDVPLDKTEKVQEGIDFKSFPRKSMIVDGRRGPGRGLRRTRDEDNDEHKYID